MLFLASMSIGQLLTSAVLICAAVILFGLAIFIHELGHFLAARWLGFKVDVFSIGFGPALLKFTRGGITYKISAIPFGGYVSIPQLDPAGMEKIQGSAPEGTAAKDEAVVESEPLDAMAPWKKMVVAVAGPAGNVVLAVICAVVIYLWAPLSATGATTTVGYVAESSLAYEHGLRRGDRILTVNGTEVTSWNGFTVECHLSAKAGESVPVSVARGSEVVELKLPMDQEISGMFAWISGILPEPVFTGVAKVVAGSPAERAGIQVGDLILDVDGVKIWGPEDVTPITRKPGEHVITLQRKQEKFQVKVTPEFNEEHKVYLIGIMPDSMSQVLQSWMSERGVWAQLKSDGASIVRVLNALVGPKASGERSRAAKALGGPVTIARVLFREVSSSLWSCLGLVRLICVNLAILNLLPIPVLDGGHLLFALYHMLRRKPVPAKVVAVLVNGFAFVLLGLMALLICRDIMGFFVSREDARTVAPITESADPGISKTESTLPETEDALPAVTPAVAPAGSAPVEVQP